MKLSEIQIRDPFILPYKNKYYMYGTAVKGTDAIPAFYVYTSSDLENWSEPKKIFDVNTGFWGKKEFWVPEIHEYSGKFYMLASFNSDDHARATHILVSDTPDGIFTPVSDKPATPEDWECLDGTLYIDKKGKPHMIFCHEWVQIGDGTICEIELSEDLKTTVSEPRVLWKASDCADVLDVIEGMESKVTDGPYFYRMNSGDLVCIWSSFNKNGYAELIAKSDNGDIDGNWQILKQPLSSKHGGHGMIFNTFDGKTMFVMHCPNDAPNERAVFYQLFEKDGELMLK